MFTFKTLPPQIQAGVFVDSKDAITSGAHFMHQVHGTDVFEVQGKADAALSHLPGHDALLTQQPGQRLIVKTADCIPLLLADVQTGTVAAIHAGWKSLVADIIPLTIQKMLDKGANSKEIWAGMGPSLGPCCSEFSDPQNEIPKKYHWAIKTHQDGRHFVHLNNIALVQMQESGIYHRNIEQLTHCTKCSPDLPSWRRDKTKQRMGAWVKIDNTAKRCTIQPQIKLLTSTWRKPQL